jgi:hypothetical protein
MHLGLRWRSLMINCCATQKFPRSPHYLGVRWLCTRHLCNSTPNRPGAINKVNIHTCHANRLATVHSFKHASSFLVHTFIRTSISLLLHTCNTHHSLTIVSFSPAQMPLLQVLFSPSMPAQLPISLSLLV